MASTKEMQKRAKDAKMAAKQPVFNELVVTQALIGLSHIMISENKKQGYTETPEMHFAADGLMKKGLYKSYNQLLTFREKFEQGLTKKYGVNLATGPAAFFFDIEKEFNRCKVPQHLQVMSGLLDLVIAKVAVKVGGVVFG